jgi:hypothetical protein
MSEVRSTSDNWRRPVARKAISSQLPEGTKLMAAPNLAATPARIELANPSSIREMLALILALKRPPR